MLFLSSSLWFLNKCCLKLTHFLQVSASVTPPFLSPVQPLNPQERKKVQLFPSFSINLCVWLLVWAWSLRSAGSNDYSHHALPLNSPRGRWDTTICANVCAQVCLCVWADSLISCSNTLRTFGSLTIGGPKQPNPHTHTHAHTHLQRISKIRHQSFSPLEVLKNEHLIWKVSTRLESYDKINMQWWRWWGGGVTEGRGGWWQKQRGKDVDGKYKQMKNRTDDFTWVICFVWLQSSFSVSVLVISCNSDCSLVALLSFFF